MKLSIYNLTLNKKTLIFFLPNFSQGGAAETLSKLMMYLAKKHDCLLICLNNCFYKKILIKNKVKIIEINSNKAFFSMFKIRNIVKKILNVKENAIFISNINYANVLSIIILRSLYHSMKQFEAGNYFESYLIFGWSQWVFVQVIINIGATTGLLPTKGLTLPFLSYGGTSLLIHSVAFGIILRILYHSMRDNIYE